jgi:hypothetical protein
VNSSSWRLTPDSCTNKKKRDRLTSDSSQTQPEPRMRLLLPESPPSEFNFSCFRQHADSASVHSSKTDTGCYTRAADLWTTLTKENTVPFRLIAYKPAVPLLYCKELTGKVNASPIIVTCVKIVRGLCRIGHRRKKT